MRELRIDRVEISWHESWIQCCRSVVRDQRACGCFGLGVTVHVPATGALFPRRSAWPRWLPGRAQQILGKGSASGFQYSFWPRDEYHGVNNRPSLVQKIFTFLVDRSAETKARFN